MNPDDQTRIMQNQFRNFWLRKSREALNAGDDVKADYFLHMAGDRAEDSGDGVPRAPVGISRASEV